MIDFDKDKLVITNTEWLRWDTIAYHYDMWVDTVNPDRETNGKLLYPKSGEFTHSMKVELMQSIVDEYLMRDYDYDDYLIGSDEMLDRGIEAYIENWED